MSAVATRAHIASQERLRAIIAGLIADAWRRLPGYDEDDVDRFVELAVPMVLAAQRQSVALTEAFIARSLKRQPLGVPPEELTGAAVRNGVEPEQVYRRPFVTVWTALQAGKRWEEAVAEGLHRATSTAATDVQLAMRGTLVAVGERDDLVLGYRRVPDGKACAFCRLVAGQRYTTDQLMPIHNHCGCGVDVITPANRGDFTGRPDRDLTVTGDDGTTAAVREHGELGPVLVNADHDFTSEADL